MKKQLAIAFSLANLAFVPTWLELLFRKDASAYYMKRLPGAPDFLAAIAGVVLLAFVLFALMRAAERSRAAKIAFSVFAALAVVIPLNVLRVKLPRETGVGRILASGAASLALLAIVAAALAFAVYRYRSRLLPTASAVIAVFAPFAALTVLRASWGAATSGGATAIDPPPLAALSTATSTSTALVVWMIFDELDYRLTFDERPKDLALPALDRLRELSTNAVNAFPPSDATLKSIPALITGRAVKDAAVGGPNELMLEIAGEPARLPWSREDNVFARAHTRGFETGVAAWYHPYCRLFAASLNHCAWWPVYQTSVGRSDDSSFGREFFDQFAAFLPTNGRRLHIESYEKVVADATRALATQKRGLIYLHLPVPHSPSIYDRRQQRTTVMRWSNVAGYVDNMALADRALGELLAAIDLDRAAVIVSADHPWRQSKAYDGKKDPRVPFLVKLPGQKTRVDHGGPVATVITQKLILELLERRVTTPEALKTWLESQERGPATTSP